MLIIVSIFVIALIAGVLGVCFVRYKDTFVLGIICMILSFFAFFASGDINGHRRGQIDAMEGKFEWEKQERSETYWKYIGPQNNE
jgi:hypothetical protein